VSVNNPTTSNNPIAVELEEWDHHLSDCGAEGHKKIRKIHQRLSDLGKDVQSLSHRLHSSKLEYLGLVAAASSFCKEFSKQHNVEIDFSHKDVPRDLPRELSLCLFRVLQEALQNALKHSGVCHFTVDLHGRAGEIQMSVSDRGVGFVQQDPVNLRGLGLISMRERLQMVNGEFSIKSELGSGTTIQAIVPFSSSHHVRAAG
jgi:signal transduction histidine kinase